MKVKIIILFFIFFSVKIVKAQYVTISDASFALRLAYSYPSCMNGNQLDTTCLAIVNETTLGIGYGDVDDSLYGLQFFDNLQTLYIGGPFLGNGISLSAFPKLLKSIYLGLTPINNLPDFPDSLVRLEIDNCSLNTLPSFPGTLERLVIDGCNVNSLPALPNSLTILICSFGELNSLPILPNSLDSIDCSYNNLTSLPALPASLSYLHCAGNQLISLPSLPNTITKLDCSYNQLTNLPVLPNLLKDLDCKYNHLNSLPSLPTTLTAIYCQHNQLTTLPSLPNALKTIWCSYNQINTIPALPTSLYHLRCDSNQLSSLPAINPFLISLYCDMNQLTSIPVLNDSIKTLVCSYNQLTSLPSLSNSLLGLSCENNLISSLPALPNLGQLVCGNNLLTSLPALPNNLFLLTCDSNNISCLPPLPVTLLDSDWFSISHNPITCLPNYVPAMDASYLNLPLCVSNDFVNNPSACTGASGVLGKVYVDNNTNCNLDTLEPFMNNVSIKLLDSLNNIQSQQNTFSNGLYNFALPTGNYTINIDTLNKPYTVNCPQPGIDSSITLTSSNPLIAGLNFPIVCKPGFDIGVQAIVTSGWVFPGQIHYLKINAGDITQWFGLNCAAGVSGNVQVTVNGPVSYNGVGSGALTPTIAGNIFTYNIPDFGAIDNSNAFEIAFTTDTVAQSNDTICVMVIVTPTSGDNNLANNNYNFCYHVVNSYDPNLKEVFPSNILPGYNDWLTYTIHFQNTGTAPAFNIRLLDTLDAKFDLNTFEMINYSHANNFNLTGNILDIRFPNIMLPDSNSNEEGSHGFVQYRIKPKNNQAEGTQIKNTAYIYFDFNAAIVTNTAVNNFTTGYETLSNNSSILKLFPNPSRDIFYMSQTGNIEVFNVMGNLIVSQNNVKQIDLSLEAKGLYFVKINGSIIRKIIKN